MARKAKTAEPSLRDKLSAAFLEAFEADFAENGIAAIQQLRAKSPEKYREISARLIAATEPQQNGFDNSQSLQTRSPPARERGMPPRCHHRGYGRGRDRCTGRFPDGLSADRAKALALRPLVPKAHEACHQTRHSSRDHR
jgi:hypothetical protein